MNLNLHTKDLALIAVYAALYAALVVVLGGISYGPIQVRVADSMVAAVPLLGIAGVLGHTLGVFIGNIFSSAGPIDLLNTIPSFVMSFVVYYVYKHTKNDYTCNRNLCSLLSCLRHNGRMDAILPIRIATTAYNRLRSD